MSNVEGVRVIDQERSRWKVKGPVGTSVEFDARTTEMNPDRGIGWNSVEGEVDTSGEVRFEEIASDRTRIEVTMNNANPPGGKVGEVVADAISNLERMDAMLSEQNEQGQLIAYNRVAGFVVAGNEDGAKNRISELASAAVELGFCVPPLAWTYWNMGPGPDYADTDHGKEWSKTTAATCAHDRFHVARALKERPIPPE